MNAMVTALTGSEEELEIFKHVPLKDTEFFNISTNFATNHRKYSKSDSSRVAEIEYTVNVKAGEPLYMYIPTDYPRECTLYLNGSSVGNYMGNKSDCVQYLGIFDEDQEIKVTLRLKDDPIYIRTKQEYFFTLDSELFKEVFTDLSAGNMEISEFDEDYIEGSVNIPAGQSLLFTSITFDEGWRVTIDGKEAKLIKTCDGLIAVDITEGKHEITFTYRPKCYTVGGAISIFGLVAFGGMIALDEYRKIREKRAWAKENNIF
jgi:uncharacterized membrane protein YfhO